ncbi:thiamine diphosphokinase [Polaribacter sp.]|uniref:thiamine diphosphokinase n=1 Tax=Polaribacter sp. TaxID=1920175 RepID=UPI0040475A06
MKSNKVFLLLHGEAPNRLPNISNYNFICATDGAYDYLKKNQISPDLITGDFDESFHISDEIEVIQTPNQDFTDFDKILQILFDKGYKNIDVFGASGKEQDHFLGNLHTAICWKNNLNIKFIDNYATYFLAENFTQLSNCKGHIISLIPFPKATNITTKGLQYSLDKEDLIFGQRIGTRNIASENTVEIQFESGEMFIFINHQKHQK